VICLREILPPDEFRAAFAEDDRSVVIDLVRTSGAIERTQAEADRLLTEARAALAEVPAGQAREALEALTHYVVERRV
jgi:geranylgeranyl pyrophosphate synthase